MIGWGALLVEGGDTLLDTLKIYLGIDVADATNDAELNRALDLSGETCERYIDRVIAKRSVDEFFQSYFGRVTLHNYPVDTTVDPVVTVDDVTDTGYSFFLQRWGLAHLTRQPGQRDQPLDWRNYQQVIVKYTTGYDPLPVDLAQALVYVAADYYTSEGRGTPPGGGGGSGEIKSMSIYDVGSISYDVGSSSSSGGTISSFGVINEAATHLLSKYKRLSA